MNHRKEEIKAGLVVVAALLIFGAMVVFIGGSGFWESLDTYRIRFSAVGGLEKGGSVRLGGLRVGRVLSIAVSGEDASKIEVTIGVKPGTPIYRGAVARVQTLGLVGDYYVLLTQEPGATDPLPPRSMIPSRDMVEMGDLLAQAAELSQTLNTSIQRVIHAVNRILNEENLMAVQQTLHSVNRLAVEGEKSLSTLTLEVENLLKGLNTAVGHVDGLVVKNSRTVRRTLLAVRRSAERLDALSRTLAQTVAENREDLRSTLATVKEDSRKAGDLIDNLNGRISITGDYLEDTMANLLEVSEQLRLLSSQLKRQPWRLIYREKAKR
ncbi:MAG: MCE family protein [Deltaproteobacteria bacterium]|nr:MCE family protein [Deltaproteobacteria bacterium]